MISIINQPFKVLLPPELSSSQLALLGARSCRVCDTRVLLFSELPTTATNPHPTSEAYEASPLRHHYVQHRLLSPCAMSEEDIFVYHAKINPSLLITKHYSPYSAMEELVHR
jgi:hypothetical protein